MKTRSKTINRLLSLALCVCMVLVLLPAIPLVTEAAAASVLYMKPNSNWTQANARFAAYFFGNGEQWVSMTDSNGDGIYEVEVPAGYTSVIFCRMNPGNSANNWDNKWNQTADLTVPTNGNTLYTVASGTWDGSGNSSSNWTAPECSYAGHDFANNSCSRCSLSYCDYAGHDFVDEVCSRCGTQGRTIYFQNNWLWEDVYVYYWKGEANNKWPGQPMTFVAMGKGEGEGMYEHYVMTIPVDLDGFIINGTKDGNTVQSLTIDPSVWYDGIAYYMFYENEQNTCQNFAICKALGDLHNFVNNVCDRCGAKYCHYQGHSFDDDICTVCGVEQITVFFENNWTWDADHGIYLYYWFENVDPNPAWPGTKMSLHGMYNNTGYYRLQIPEDVAGIIISGYDANKPEGEHNQQTPNIEDGWYNGITYRMEWADDHNDVSSYDINTVFKCAVGHIYGEPTYTWSADNSICRAIRTCERCGATETADWASAATPEQFATCKEPAILRYIASFVDVSWAEAQEKLLTDPLGELDSSNHVDSETVYVDNGDGTHVEKWDCCDAVVIETEAHADEDNSGRCDRCDALMAPAALRKASVSLKGNIAVNYYMLMSEELYADETAYMQFTLADGEIRKVPANEGEPISLDGETYYVYSCEVSAKEMTDTIISQFFYGNTATAEKRYSIQTYGQNILNQYDDPDTRNLIVAMLNYGTAAQIHFGYKTDDLANAILDEMPDYSNVTIEGYPAVTGQGTAQAKLYSATLILKSETTVRFYLTDKVTATYEGQELAVYERGTGYYVEVVGISAKDLDRNVTVTITDRAGNSTDILFNPLTYCQVVLNDTTGAFEAPLKDLSCALYLYNRAANAYFKEI